MSENINLNLAMSPDFVLKMLEDIASGKNEIKAKLVLLDDVIKKDVKVKKEKKQIPLLTQHTEIIDRWNKHVLVLQTMNGMMHDCRNQRIEENEVNGLVVLIARTISRIGKEKIFEFMDSYFECCKARKHIWDGKNHGYSNVGGLLRKLLRYDKIKRVPWWTNAFITNGGDDLVAVENVDDNPELTKIVTNVFASRYMKSDSCDLKGTPKTQVKFIRVSKLVKEIVDLEVLPFSDPIASLLKGLFSCIEKLDDTVVFPGHLISESVWKIQLPQYLSNMGIPDTSLRKISAVIAKHYE